MVSRLLISRGRVGLTDDMTADDDVEDDVDEDEEDDDLDGTAERLRPLVEDVTGEGNILSHRGTPWTIS
jgi:hypothetical protein